MPSGQRERQYPQSKADFLIDHHLAVALTEVNGILRAIAIQAMSASCATVMVDHGRPATGNEAALYVARTILGEVHAHAAARAAEANFKESVHLVVLEAPDELLDLNPERLAGETEGSGFLHALICLLLCELHRHAMVDDDAAAKVEEQARQIMRVILAIAPRAT